MFLNEELNQNCYFTRRHLETIVYIASALCISQPFKRLSIIINEKSVMYTKLSKKLKTAVGSSDFMWPSYVDIAIHS